MADNFELIFDDMTDFMGTLDDVIDLEDDWNWNMPESVDLMHCSSDCSSDSINDIDSSFYTTSSVRRLSTNFHHSTASSTFGSGNSSHDSGNNSSNSEAGDAEDVFSQQKQWSSKTDIKKQMKHQTKPRKRRQNISRRPAESDAQLKERRYQAKLKRNRESGKRARRRQKDTIGLLELEQELLLKQLQTKRSIVKRLEQQNAQLKQDLISARASNHPLLSNNSPRVRRRRSQEHDAPPLTMFAVAFVALLTWSAALESSSLYDTHNDRSKAPSHAKVFPAGASASLGTPAAAVALQPMLEYVLQLHMDNWYALQIFVQLMIIFAVSVCLLGLYPSIIRQTPKVGARCRLQSSTRSTRVSFTSPSNNKDRVRGMELTRCRRVITYII